MKPKLQYWKPVNLREVTEDFSGMTFIDDGTPVIAKQEGGAE